MFEKFKLNNILLINILIFLSITVLFLKFFIFIDFYPLHDEIVIVERNTELQNFLWRNYTSNHTLNSVFAVTIKNIIGYNLLYYRFFSFLCFIGILLLCKKIYPNTLIFSLLIIFILSSNVLTNYIWIFRGYYIWGFLTVLNFFLLKSFYQNSFDNKNFKLLMLVNLILSCHALFVLYNVVPTMLYLFFITVNRKDKEKFLYLIFWFFCPLIIFYFIIITLEGFTIVFWDNLNVKFLLNNFILVIKDSFVPGFKEIFLSQHFDQYFTDKNLFLEVFKKLINPPYNMEPEYTFIFIYFISFFILISKIISKKYDYLDFIFLGMILFFYLIDKNPEPRQHTGIVFYLIFYILDFVFYLNHKIKNKKIIGYIACCISLFLIFNTSLNEKFYDTRKSIDKIKPLYLKYNCDNLNNKLSDYEVWVLKNTHIFNCNFYYDFKLKKNILVN